jgi:hypothetical protein
MSKQAFRTETITQDIALLRHLRSHLAALSDDTSLQLLSLAGSVPITNSEVSSTTGKNRNVTWYQLAKLTKLGMLDKRGNKYRISPYALNLIEAAALTFRAVVNGKMPKVESSDGRQDLLRIASEGTESLYLRGTIDQAEYSRRLKVIQGFVASSPRDTSDPGKTC